MLFNQFGQIAFAGQFIAIGDGIDRAEGITVDKVKTIVCGLAAVCGLTSTAVHYRIVTDVSTGFGGVCGLLDFKAATTDIPSGDLSCVGFGDLFVTQMV